MSRISIELLKDLSGTSGSFSFSGNDDQQYNTTQNIKAQVTEETYVEYVLNDPDNNTLNVVDYYNNFFIDNDGETLTVNLEDDIVTYFNVLSGEYIVEYNVYNKKCGSSPERVFFINEISPSRTEIRADSSVIDDFVLADKTLQFLNEREQTTYFKEFLLNFGNNNLAAGVNIALDTTSDNTQILIKLKNPLPNDFDINSQFWLVEQIGANPNYFIEFTPDIREPLTVGIPLAGPNLNLIDRDLNSKQTFTGTLESLESTNLPSSSIYQLNSVISSSGININLDYNKFEEFVFFSSATERLKNFFYKISLLQDYSSSLNTATSTTTNTSATSHIFRDKINQLVSNFDNYEKFLYYESGSNSWPKVNDTPPFQLHATSSTEVSQWYGSLDEQSSNYGGILLSASSYDNLNRNNLLYSIPEFIRLDTNNKQYEVFISMIGQHYDNIWTYTKDITKKFDADNRINFGISKDLVADAIKDFSLKIYENNFSTYDLYSAFTGFPQDSSSLGVTGLSDFPPLIYGFSSYGESLYGPLPLGTQLVTNLITASNDIIPIDDINKRTYKKIYHNVPYLLRAKGTKTGLKSLISLYGIPETILQVNEFGAKDKVSGNDWDFYRKIYNKALFISGSSSPDNMINTQWANHDNDNGLNPDWGISPLVPRTVEYRFKSTLDPNTLPSQSNIRQSTFTILDDSISAISSSVSVVLEYNGSGSYTGSYSGSIMDPRNNYADLTLYVSGSSQYYSSSINLPFLNKDWWSVMLQYHSSSNTFELYSGNKIYNGGNGTKLGFTSSTSITVPAAADTLCWRSGSLARIGASKNSYNFAPGITGSSELSGSIQEVRYWINTLSESVWYNHIMNPLSIENGVLTGLESTRESLAFRTREGEDYSIKGTLTNTISGSSIHPKVTGSLITTASFITRGNKNSFYNSTGLYFSNSETQFLNQPVVGIKNRVTDRIRVENLEFPQGNALSPYRRIEQNNYSSRSFTEGINYIEVGFSPSNQINDDIISELGGFNIEDYIGDPRLASSSLNYYPALNDLRDKFFEKYLKNYEVLDFIRLIKNFDNSLFKMIKDFTPIRNSSATGVIIKQHLLERQKYPEPVMTFTNVSKTGSILPSSKNFITGSSDFPQYSTSGSSIYKFSGGTGGSFEVFNSTAFHPYGPNGTGPDNRFDITQSLSESIIFQSGSTERIYTNQDEFYDGIFPGTNIIVTTQSLNPGCLQFSNINTEGVEVEHEYDRFVYRQQSCSLDRFENPNTAPRTGEIFFFKKFAQNKFTNIKISNTTKAGIDISNVLTQITTLAFDFSGINQSIAVDFVQSGQGFTEYKVVSPFSTYDISNFTSNFVNYSASVEKTSSFHLVKIADQGTEASAFTETIIIDNFDIESDPSGLLNSQSGIYTSPLTNNRRLNFTCSISGSYAFTNNTTANIQYGVRVGLKNITRNELLKSNGFSVGLTAGNTLTQSFDFDFKEELFPQQALVTGDQVAVVVETDFDNNQFDLFGSSSLSISSSLFAINQNGITSDGPVSTLTSIQPGFLSDNTHFFNHFDCQPLLNNVSENTISGIFFDVDYSSGTVLPINFLQILNRTAVKAQVQDSNYFSKSWSNIRYNGVKLSSAILNKYSAPNTLVLPDGTIWKGDISFGKQPVIEQTKPNFGYFKLLVPTSPELEKGTQVKLQYLINKQGQAFKPLLNSPSFFDVEGTYETNNLVDIALNDSFQTDGGNFPTNAAAGINLDNFNTQARVIRGARRVDPILTTQFASIFDGSVSEEFTGSINFTNPSGLDTNFSFQGGKFADTTYNPTSNPSTGILTVSCSNEGYDPAGLYDHPNSIWENTTGDRFNLTPIRFRFQGAVLNSTTATSNISIEWIRTGVPNVFFGLTNIPANTSLVFNDGSVAAGDPIAVPDLVTPYIFPAAGDQVRVRLQFTSLGDVNLNNTNFYGEPEQLPIVAQTGSFWETGSAFPNSTQLTSSRDLAQYYNTSTQVQYPESTFKPINEVFTIKPGDQFRFLGSENNVHTVSNVSIINQGVEAGKILVDLQPPVGNGLNLDKFLIRRFNRDGTSVILDLNPPNSGFGTTSGVVKNVTVNEDVESNINVILSDLVKDGTIN
tara:strand:+ start:5195 stop:11476 length:6282 start_codon:yes stop_codon:yes gene_type:complete